MPTRPEPPSNRPHRAAGRAASPVDAASAREPGANEAGKRVRRVPRSNRGSELSSTVAANFALAIGRTGIGLELAEAAEIGCVRVSELSSKLLGVRFPVDVSGGVSRFRHRRGELQSLRLEVAARDLEKAMGPRLRGLVGTRTPEVWIEVGRGSSSRATICVAAAPEADSESEASIDVEVGMAASVLRPSPRSPPPDGPVVAFDLHLLAEGEDLVFVVANPRGASLPAPPSAIAIACVEAVLGTSARRSGAIFTLGRPARLVTLALFPAAGARLPSTDGVRWSGLATDGGTWILHAAHDADPVPPTEDALRAREVAALLVEGDEALLGGDPSARTLYLQALERAPRHGEIAARVVAIDARTNGRAEAALATLAESVGPSPRGGGAAGLVTGELLAEVGDTDAAIASFERAGEAEPAPALAARAFELASRVASARDPEAATRWLDRALALYPRSITARWARVAARLVLGRLEDALADVEHLEALARGSRAKFSVWLRAGRTWTHHGLASRAGAVFERALRYAPDEPRALTGLGAALLGEGREARGVSLLERALAIVLARGGAEAPILLELAKALAERLDDLPTAVAHISAIPATAVEAPVARGLEGRWRARLGDLAGASLAFARLRDLAASHAPPGRLANAGTDAVVALLLEAAAMERAVRGDALAAQRHLAVALRLSPHHPEARAAYREVGALIVRGASDSMGRDDSSVRAAGDSIGRDDSSVRGESDVGYDDAGEGDDVALPEHAAPRRLAAMDLALVDGGDDAYEPAAIEKAARVDELTRRLRDDPGNDTIADELTALLEELDRAHELVALLTGRLEDAPPERRAELGARARATFERMADKAAADDEGAHAALYADALEAVANALANR